MLIVSIVIALYSTGLYLYLHRKTHINLSYLYKDNILVILLSILACFGLDNILPLSWMFVSGIVAVLFFCIVLSVARFFRTPSRKVSPDVNSIASPADGNIIYIRRIEYGQVPISVKNGLDATLSEFSGTGLLDYPCWLIGINMTPFDVHKNAAPYDGTVVMNKHIEGEFLSLKAPDALQRNERNSIILDSSKGRIGIVQTASKRVRRIVTYVKEGEHVNKGEWFGMIKFGSQVDLIIPADCKIRVQLKEQVFAQKTIIATWQ